MDLFGDGDADLFGGTDIQIQPPRVLMSLHAEYYDLMWSGAKIFEYRKRYIDGPSTWYVYLNAPVSRLTAVIDLDRPITGSPTEIADLAERARTGNGPSVLAYLSPAGRGVALPIRHVREYPGVTAEQLTAALGKWHPPQGYTLIDRHPELAKICDEFTAATIVRERPIDSRISAVP